jgi:NDP-sugar pyrophosphorylase family protein
MKSAQLVIPMSGVGERFQRAGYELPKPLILVEGKPIIEHVLDMYPGWDDVLFIVNEEHLAVESWNLEETLRRLRPMSKIVPIAKHKKGPAWAINMASQYIEPDKPVVANYCDFTCRWDLSAFESKLQSGLDGVIPTYTGFHPHMLRTTAFAYVKKSGQRVIDIQEKQSWTDDPFQEEASSGTYAFGSGRILLDAIESQIEQNHSLNGEFYLSLTYKSMFEKGMKVESFLIDHFMQWGTPEDLLDYEYWSELFSKIGTTVLPESPTISPVILAAGEGRRFTEAGYVDPKPLIEFSGEPMLKQAVKALGSPRALVVSRNDLPQIDRIESCAASIGAQTIYLESLTQGQAETALIALEDQSLRSAGQSFVGACDAIIVPSSEMADAAISENEIWVWVTKNYRPALVKPTDFGWVRCHEQTDEVAQVLVKEEPIELSKWSTITGSFTFGSIDASIALLKEFVLIGPKINGEYYLDSLLEFAMSRGWTVKAKEPELFISIGTPSELKSFSYWQKCFHLWNQHPYKLPRDPFVPTSLRSQLVQ